MPGGSRAGYENERLKLARLRLAGVDARTAAVRQIAETSARALGVERVGVWMLRNGGVELECLCMFLLSTGSFSSGTVVDGRTFPGFMAAVRERRVLVVPDISASPHTAEILPLLDPVKVVSIMVAPIIREGAVTALISYGHVGTIRPWPPSERDFAASAADMAALFFEQADRLEIEAALHARRERSLVDEKMVALGRLARSVAHDVADVLGALGMIGVALEADSSEHARAHGAEVRRCVALGGRLVEQLVLFGRQEEPGTAAVEVGGLLRRIEPVLRRLAGEARFEINVALPDAWVAAEAAEIEQVALNLSMNAVEAVEAGGSVRIELREPLADEAVSPGAVILAVTDDGVGMDAKTQAHMFEPYFSRKPGGHGIGLATVYGIVKRCGGVIMVDSQPGAGTTFRIALPRAVGRLGAGGS